MLLIHQLDARHRNANLDGLDGGVAAASTDGKGAHPGASSLPGCHKASAPTSVMIAERAFRAHQQPGEIIARRRFLGPRSGADDLAIGHDGCEAHAHSRASCHSAPHWCPRPASPPCRRGWHQRPDRSGRTGPGRANGCSGSCGSPPPPPGIEIRGIHLKNPVHLRKIDRRCRQGGGEMAFQRGARAIGE